MSGQVRLDDGAAMSINHRRVTAKRLEFLKGNVVRLVPKNPDDWHPHDVLCGFDAKTYTVKTLSHGRLWLWWSRATSSGILKRSMWIRTFTADRGCRDEQESLFPAPVPLVVGYGMGLDSTMLVEMHNRGIRPDLMQHAHTGGEWPHTYAYRKVTDAWLALRSLGSCVGRRAAGAKSEPHDDIRRTRRNRPFTSRILDPTSSD